MALYFWHPWKHQEQEPNATDKTEIILEIEKKGKLSEEVQRLVLNCHSYFCESNGTQCSRKKKKNSQSPKDKILEAGKVMKNGRGKYQRKQNLLTKTDDFLENFTTYNLWFLPKQNCANVMICFVFG